MASLTFTVARWAAWRPDCETLLGDGRGPGRTAAIPASLRRRVSAIGRKALEAAWQILPQDGSPRLVLSSRHGEYQRTFGLLTSVAEDGTVSPAEFGLAVHHALAGLLSIATANHSGHTAISAGADSFGYGLLEAAACLDEDRAPVLLIHFDECLPQIYPPLSDGGDPPLALAVLLVPPADGQAIEVTHDADRSAPADAIAHQFLDFLRSPEAERRVAGWRWRRVA